MSSTPPPPGRRSRWRAWAQPQLQSSRPRCEPATHSPISPKNPPPQRPPPKKRVHSPSARAALQATGRDDLYSDIKEPGNLDVKGPETGDLNVKKPDDTENSSMKTALHLPPASRQMKNWDETCAIGPPPTSPPSSPSPRPPPPSPLLGEDVCATTHVRPDLAFSHTSN